MRVRFLGGEGVSLHQWGRFKRREDSILVFIIAALVLHVGFWVIWHFFVAPYPIALTIPLAKSFGTFNFLYDYFWPLGNTCIMLLNLGLAWQLYRKDIFASWLLLGANVFLQCLAVAITLFLISFSSPF